MYTWLVFLHTLSVVLFLLAHGASHIVSLRIPGERKPERLRALLDLSSSSYNVMFAALALALVFGVAAGFVGKWWDSLWIWTALGLLFAVSVTMYVLAQRNYVPLRAALSRPDTDEKIAALAAATGPLPNIIIGIGGLAVLTWLMFFKPF